jgi:amino acid adenylation domain-containing protein/non-ribosomal peptide synthase protein (TIGR01720 family)
MTVPPQSATLSRAEKQEMLRKVLLERISRTRTAPASFAQERLWFLDRMQAAPGIYNVPQATRLTGALHVPALERALGEVVRRHDALRTTFQEQGGAPVQVIAPFAGFTLPLADLSGLADAGREAEVLRRAREEGEAAFDLAAGPLFRATLLRLGAEEHVLLLCMHHSVCDGWSQGVMWDELRALYAAFLEGRPSPLGEVPVQYADYVAWQRGHLRGEVLERQVEWWRERLAGAPTLLELPTDRPRPAVQTYRGACERFRLPAALAERLEAVARGEGATLYMLLLGAYQVLLSKYSRSEDVVVGSPTAGRTRRELESTVGFFIHTLVLRTDLSGDPSFREVLRRVREVTLGAYDHQEVPFESLVEALQPERSLGHNPLFQAFFALPDVPGGGEAGLAGLTLRPVRVEVPTAKFDLSLFMSRGADGLFGLFEYATDLFDAATVRRMAGHLESLLTSIADDPARPLSTLPLATAGEREALVAEWSGAGASFPVTGALHQRFEARAAQRPTDVAVTCEGESLTYGELNARANRLARRLRALGVGPESRVGLCAERSLELVAGVLAIVKAGAAYVPLDPAYPADRLAYMAEDAGLRVLLAQDALRGRVAVDGLEIVSLEEVPTSESADDLGIVVDSANLAYVIYTSGSTGRPKGVGVTHGNVLRLFDSTQASFAFGAADVWTLFHSYAFDFSVWEIWGALLHGGRLVVVPWAVSRDPAAFRALLRSERVTVLNQTPSAFRALCEADEREAEPLTALRTVVFGGEALQYESLRGWLDRYGPRRPRLVNMYGITETTVHVTWHTVTGRELRDPTAGSGVGTAIPDLRAYVLDPAGHPCPAGVPGELHVGGAGLARGYLGRPGLTAQRLVPDPFSGDAGARLYRSGDLARWKADGTLEYLGRIDQQVKVRGFRIELGEIESTLLAHPAVSSAAVVVRGEGEDAALVAYVVPNGEMPGAGELRDALKKDLPEYMVPAAFVAMERIPLTTNGKLDRKALPEPGSAGTGADEAYLAPRTPVEEMLAAVWCEVLGAGRVGASDDFFELGGHSLRAMQVVARIRELFGVSLPLRAFFEGSTVAELATRVEEARRAGEPILPPVVPVEHDGPAPLSFGQERLWFVDRLQPGTATYNVPSGVRLTGALHVPALERALGEIVRRHQALRTTFAEVDGVPVQVIAPFAGFPVAVDDLSMLDGDARDAEVGRRASAHAGRPFDLAAGPLFRATLLRLGEQEHVLLLCLHHAVADGWSTGVLFRELSALYGAYRAGGESPLAELPVQYADYAVWQRQRLRGEVLERQLAWWRERLAGAPALLDLPTDRPRSAVQTYRGGRGRVQMPAELAERLQALGRGEGATPYMVLLAAFQLLLSKYSGSDDVVVGSPVAGRTGKEVEGLIGFFVNTLVLRTDLSGDPTFREALRRVRDATLGAYEHQDVPFERLVKELQPERSLSHAALYQVEFSLQNMERADGALAGLRTEWVGAELDTTQVDLSLHLALHAGGIAGEVTYSTDLFDRATVERMMGHLRRLLEQVAADADLRLSQVSLLDDDERRRVVEGWNRADAEYTADACIHQLFEAQAERTPAADAVRCEGRSLTYRELNERANRLAHHLVRLGVGPEVRVGLCIERSLEMVVSILAILKAGGAYVPLDPTYPADRLAFMLADSAVPVLVTQERLRGALPPRDGVRAVSVDGDAAAIASGPAGNPASAATPASLAYVIYTSGSTGTPKGALIEHRNVARLFSATDHWFGFGAGDVWTLFHSYAFDFSVWEIWGALLYGGRLVVVPFHVSRDPEAFHALLQRERVTVLSQTPSAFRQLIRADGERGGDLALRYVVFGGEALEPATLRDWVERRGDDRPWLVNMYGITETTVHVTHRVIRHADVFEGSGSPIGERIPDLALHVLDAARNPLPVGVPGELYVGGAGVARGYLNRPELTAERFIDNPFGPGRLYRTGDRVRRLADGTLDYLGRLDEQVKIRGFRIELGEIETALLGHPGIRECAVAVREDRPGDRRLAAYLVGDAEAESLRAHLRRTLPEYMVPAAFVTLAALPLTGNGKLDRKALPAPEAALPVDGFVAPRTEMEQVLADIWAEVLRLERVGVEDGFFALGGDSILVIQIVSRARRAGVEITPRLMFEHQTVAELAAVARRGGAAPRAEQGRVEGSAALTPIQAWFFEQDQPLPAHYNQSVFFEVAPSVRDAALETALAAVLDHHDALRLRFRRGAGGWEQTHAARVEIALERVDLAPLGDDAARVQGEIAHARQTGLSLEDGPLGRAVLFVLPRGRRVLFLTLHHLVVDGVSWRIVRDDLERAVADLEAGRAAGLGDKSTSFRAWSAALRAYASSPALAAEAEYWHAQGSGGVAPLPALGPGDRSRHGARTVTVRLGVEETRALLHDVPAAYHSQVNDALLAALAEAVGGWTGSPRVRLALEGHGREEEVVGAGVDLTRTVGWFTSVYPVVLDLGGAAGPGERLKRVKEQLRAVPGRGIGYGVLRYLSPGVAAGAALAAEPEPEIAFNYQGRFDDQPQGAARFRFAGGPAGERISAANQRRYALEVDGAIDGGCLVLHWTYADGAHRRETIERVAESYLHALRGLIAHCQEPGAGGFTPSDFPLAALTQRELDALLAGGRAVEDIYPLSPMQEGLLFHALSGDAQTGGGSQAYQVQLAWKIEGRLDVPRFRRAWAEAARRHAILRTSFAWEGLRRPMQVVHPAAELEWMVGDWAGLPAAAHPAALDAYLAADREAGFRLDEAPLMRCGVFGTGESGAWFVWSHHHLLLDGWACSRVAAEVFRLYHAWTEGGDASAGAAPGRVRPYRDYIGWLARQDRGAAERYWRGVLSGFGAPTPLAADRPAAPGVPARPARLERTLTAERSAALEGLARRAGVTLNTVLQGAWGLLLARYGGEDDVVFGTTVSGRPAGLDGVEEMVGLFINTLPVRVRVRGEARLGEWLAGLQRAQAEAREYEYAPLAAVQGWSEVPGGTPLFESLFVFENYPAARGGDAHAAALRVADARAVEWTSYPLTLVTGPGARIQLSLAYDRARFDDGTAERLLGHFERILEQAAEAGDRRVSDLSPLDEDERRHALEAWNQTDAAFPAHQTLHALVEAQAARTPLAPAVTFEGASLTYAELNERANRLAHHLIGLGVGPEVRVGLCMERSLEMVTSILAILKAGGAYVPLDPDYPAERLAYMLEDSAVPVLLTGQAGRDTLPAREGTEVIALDARRAAIGREPAGNPRTGVTPANLAYVIYTSGSTGRPKGVMNAHRGVVSRLCWMQAEYGLSAADVVLQKTPFSFDVSVWEFLWPLMAGARLAVARPGGHRDPEYLCEEIEREGVTTLHFVPSMLQPFVETAGPGRCPTLTRVICSGEALSPVQAERFHDRFAAPAALHNLYGPTEAAVDVTHWACPRARQETVPIGRPVWNTRLYVLDAALRPVPTGVPGELYIGGVQVARGYLGRPALTAERFVPDPFARDSGARLYRTGDRARRRADGAIEYLGRLDAQVKIRGFRIEPGEVEAALGRHPGVRECAVVVREDAPGDRRLAAYVVGTAQADELRAHLLRVLPEYMVPAAFVALGTLPLTSNGKLDRRALPAPERPARGAPAPPRSQVEERVAAVWREVLGVSEVGVHDNFFELGGNSLLLVRVHGELRGLKDGLRVVDLFRYPTLEALGAYLGDEAPRDEGTAARGRSRGAERRAAWQRRG